MADTVDGAAVPEKKEKKGKEKKERGPLRQDHLGKLYFISWMDCLEERIDQSINQWINQASKQAYKIYSLFMLISFSPLSYNMK